MQCQETRVTMKIIDYLNSKKINSNAIYALDEKGYHHLDVFVEV